MFVVVALVFGIVSGLRTFTSPAAASWAARTGLLAVSGTPLAFMGFSHSHHLHGSRNRRIDHRQIAKHAKPQGAAPVYRPHSQRFFGGRHSGRRFWRPYTWLARGSRRGRWRHIRWRSCSGASVPGLRQGSSSGFARGCCSYRIVFLSRSEVLTSAEEFLPRSTPNPWVRNG